MKNILISIKPQWVEKILNGEKNVEIRKTMPKCELPCKVYIYCTKVNKELRLFNQKACASFKIPRTKTYSIAQQKVYTKFIGDESQSLNGKVVAEFILNTIDKIEICDPYIFRNNKQEDWKYFEKNACLNCEQMMEYIGYGEDYDGWDKKYAIGYAWHIDNLIIYDKPKELREFRTLPCNKPESACRNCKYLQVTNTPYAYESECFVQNGKILTRAPQSWCYVEEKGEEV